MIHCGTTSGPFFVLSDGNFLNKERFVWAVQKALLSAGFESTNYAGHSFRNKAAITAARQGIQDSVIKMLGHWQSSAYTLYIRTPCIALCEISKRLVTESDNEQISA